MAWRRLHYQSLTILVILTGLVASFNGQGLLASTNLDIAYRLVGTAVAEDPDQSLAVIENSARKTQAIYRRGDRLDGMRVKEITFGKVIVDTGSTETILAVGGKPHEDPLAESSKKAPETAANASPDDSLNIEEIDDTIPDYRHLMQEISVRSQFEGGKPIGFVIYRIEPGSIFERMGLMNSDVIVSINGIQLTGTQPVMEFYDALKTGGTISLEIRREEAFRKLLFEIW